MFRDGVKSVLSDEASFEIIGEVGNANDLYLLLQNRLPNLIITDISLPFISGIDITKYVRANYPQIKIMVLSMHTNEEYISKALCAGANGYLPKDAGMEELIKAIRVISEGGRYFTKEISDTILDSFIKQSQPIAPQLKNESLTNREKEVIRLVVDGLSNKEIADTLVISVRTVDSHKNNIMQKLQLKSSVELVKYAIKNNLASLD